MGFKIWTNACAIKCEESKTSVCLWNAVEKFFFSFFFSFFFDTFTFFFFFSSFFLLFFMFLFFYFFSHMLYHCYAVEKNEQAGTLMDNTSLFDLTPT